MCKKDEKIELNSQLSDIRFELLCFWGAIGGDVSTLRWQRSFLKYFQVKRQKFYDTLTTCDTTNQQSPLLYKQLSDSTAGGNEIRSRNLKSVFLRNRSMNSKHPSLTFSSAFDLVFLTSRKVVSSRIVIEINYISFTKIKSLSRWCSSVLLMRKVTSSFLST